MPVASDVVLMVLSSLTASCRSGVSAELQFVTESHNIMFVALRCIPIVSCVCLSLSFRSCSLSSFSSSCLPSPLVHMCCINGVVVDQIAAVFICCCSQCLNIETTCLYPSLDHHHNLFWLVSILCSCRITCRRCKR